MRRMEWGAVAGCGIAGLLLLAPSARADEPKSGSATSQDSQQGMSGTADQGSGARGTGMGGTSTGARPGEVTGAPSAPGGTSEKEQRAQAKTSDATHLSGKVEKYDRAARTLSIVDSDKQLKVTDDTQVFKGGDRVSPGQIMEGDEVRASFTGSGDTLEAVRIDVSGAPASGAGSSPRPSTGTDVKGGSPKGTAAGSSSETGSGSTGTK
jgi:hypothetical protein